MATFLDVTSLEAFSKIFVFLLVFLGLAVLFTTSKFFQGNKWIGWIIALLVAIFVVLTDILVGIIRYITPWFAVLFIFVIFIVIASQLFGAGSTDFGQYKPILFLVIIIIFVVGTVMYIRTNITVPGDIDKEGNVIKEKDYTTSYNFIFHPKIMGIIFILLVAIFTVALMAGKAT
jgi:hypothetical protein